MIIMPQAARVARRLAIALTGVLLAAASVRAQQPATQQPGTQKPATQKPATQKPATHRSFATPEEAVRALIAAARADGMGDLLAIFGPDAKAILEASDPATTRKNRQVFTVATKERWSLEDRPDGTKVLVIGHELWPFPVPLAKGPSGWRFDTAAGAEEVVARRIGRNELAVIQICQTYVRAQKIYAASGHDGQAPGAYAQRFRSETGKQNGLYWPSKKGQKRSPLGDLVAEAATEGQAGGGGSKPAPFQGYYFRILTAQGPAAPGGAKDYVAGGRMSGGFALVAWPAQYDVTGVMTFMVSHDGSVVEKDLGPKTDATARAMTRYDPDPSWAVVSKLVAPSTAPTR